VIAVIKADAYGHGAVPVARALPDADAFAVATSMEALELREAGVLDPVIHQDWQLQLLAEAERHQPIDVWLKFNSGMGRLGFEAEALQAALAFLVDLPGLGEIRLMTHLANADDREDAKSLEQIERVDALGLQDYEWGVANSAGTQQRLKPAMQFESRLLAINERRRGQGIGYGGRFVCPRDMRIGVVAAGYADGYPRHLQGGQVVVNGRHAPVIGRVSMDMVTIDLEGIDAVTGDRVILWGQDPLAIDIAEHSETIAYELFCHAGWRLALRVRCAHAESLRAIRSNPLGILIAAPALHPQKNPHKAGSFVNGALGRIVAKYSIQLSYQR